MKHSASIKILVGYSVLLFACKSDPLSPGFEYMPDMYRSKSLETYGEYSNQTVDGNENTMSARKPVAGSVARGYDLYPYANTIEGYEAAGLQLKNPIPCSPQVLAEGQAIYGKFCTHCHGDAGKGDGSITKSSKWPGPPPAYDSPQLIDLPEGKMFHSITFGKGNMGAHASQLSQTDRWKLVHYIQKLQGKKAECEKAMAVVSADTDGDGVEDKLDQCPNTPGTKNYYGCPEVEKEVADVMDLAIKGVLFNSGSADIKKESLSVLDQVVTVLSGHLNYKLNVNGHTDNLGDAAENLALSQDRAASVKKYLVSKGLAESRIVATGYGDTKPIADNATAEGKGKNRRVEFRIIY